MTPGDVLTTDTSVICQVGYSSTVRDVPQSLKDQVYRNYGITSRKPKEYEIDHLISLQLGGSNAIMNLWPQSYITQPLNAYTKDKLENKLRRMVCKGELDIKVAQQEIAKDWIGAYKKYIGPLPTTEKSDSSNSSTTETPQNKSKSKVTTTSVLSAEDCPQDKPIKVSGSGIFHVPGGSFYDRTKAKSCFSSAFEAEFAGYRASKR